MPCSDEYNDRRELSERELDLSRVAGLLDEYYNGTPITKAAWNGYHPAIYGQNVSRELGDKFVRELCDKLQEADVTKRSLEMQIWWRDHQQQDKERVEAELSAAKTAADREAALAKLTPYERQLIFTKGPR